VLTEPCDVSDVIERVFPVLVSLEPMMKKMWRRTW